MFCKYFVAERRRIFQRFCTALHSITRYRTQWRSTALYGIAPHGTARHRTAWRDLIQHCRKTLFHTYSLRSFALFCVTIARVRFPARAISTPFLKTTFVHFAPGFSVSNGTTKRDKRAKAPLKQCQITITISLQQALKAYCKLIVGGFQKKNSLRLHRDYLHLQRRYLRHQ